MRLKSLDRLRGHPLSFYVCSHPSGAVSRTEDASGAAGGCPQSVESAVLRAFEDASRTRGACFVHRVPQKTPSVQKRGFSCTECPFRTVEACFLHRVLPKTRRVPQEAFLSTARIFRTIGGPLRYRMPDTEAGCRRSGAWRTF